MSEAQHDYHLNAVASHAEAMLDEVQKLHRYSNDVTLKIINKYTALLKSRDKVLSAERSLLRAKEKAIEKREKGLLSEIATLKLKLEQYERGTRIENRDKIPVAKATTLSIYDSIIFAISNWSTDGQTAPDVELACQSILFPCIYQKVMEGLEDYYFDEVPTSALLVVQRGREYVQHLRATEDRLITDSFSWETNAPLIQEWWINDALPLLYGARDDDWSNVIPKTLNEMIVWRDQPASRALDFPLIWDGMELVKAHSNQIREHSGLPEFNKLQLTTRIEP